MALVIGRRGAGNGLAGETNPLPANRHTDRGPGSVDRHEGAGPEGGPESQGQDDPNW